MCEEDGTLGVEQLSLRVPGNILGGCALAAVGGGKVAALGGRCAHSSFTNRVSLLDASAGTCRELAPLPVSGRYDIGCTAAGSFVFGFGGAREMDQRETFVYDTVTEWSSCPSALARPLLPDSYAALAISGEYLWVFGGWNDFRPRKLHVGDLYRGRAGPEVMARLAAATGVPLRVMTDWVSRLRLVRPRRALGCVY